ncbi:hypothetical protein C8Q79DRAFT_997656 [Trametes meyenii]|nr:hypothetical protein C8Q79DRAFT_997656 [Trametes meyenii]
MDDMLTDLYAQEYDDDIPATTWCRECRAKEALCTICVVTAHRNLPYHWIEWWNGTFFTRRDLADFGFVVHLGHHGDPCPHLPTNSVPANFVIVHDNGVHRCNLSYCHCPGRRAEWSQLIRRDLFPASMERVETAFTCELLERFHVDFDVTKRSVQDFMQVLSHISGGEKEQGQAKDRYHSFMLAARIYRHLTTMKRSGGRHNVVIPGRRRGELSVPCLTCPIPNFNLPADWKETPESLKYLYRLILCADGNYSLQKKTKKDDSADAALSTGQGFFMPHAEMFEYLNKKYHGNGQSTRRSQGGDAEDISLTCSGFKVVRSQRKGKFKNVDVSGVMSFSCDHLIFRPGATVDLQTTETWGHADFGLAAALRGTELLEERALSVSSKAIQIWRQ